MSRWRLENGLQVLYRQDAFFPLASATLLLGAGSRIERLDQSGLSSITLDLMMQGTRHRSARALASVMESVGASMGTQVHEDYAEMGFLVPSTELSRAFGVMAEVLQEPSFPQVEINKEKAHILAGLSSRKDAIFNVAGDALNEAMYGDHPYGRLVEGREGTVKKFERNDFQRWHAAEIIPHSAILSWTGPLPVTKAKHLTEKHLRGWGTMLPSYRRKPALHTSGGPGRLSSGDPVPSAFLDWAPSHSSQGIGRDSPPVVRGTTSAGVTSKNSSTHITIRSNFEQAYLMVGYPAPCATDPDHIPLKILNTILGGGMSSRLFEILREEFGLAYEVSSYYPTRLDRSQWVIYLGLPVEKLEKAIRQLNLLLRRLADEGPTLAEVKQARAMLRGAFLMDRQSHRRQAWYSAWWQFLGRGQDYGDEFLKAIDAVTPKQLRALSQKMLKQPSVTVTVVPK